MLTSTLLKLGKVNKASFYITRSLYKATLQTIQDGCWHVNYYTSQLWRDAIKKDKGVAIDPTLHKHLVESLRY